MLLVERGALNMFAAGGKLKVQRDEQKAQLWTPAWGRAMTGPPELRHHTYQPVHPSSLDWKPG